MSCPACTEAEIDPLTGSQHAGCIGCEERAIAHSPAAWWAWSPRAKHPTRCDLINALRRVFGDDWLTHEPAVKRWWDRIKEAREQGKSGAQRTNAGG